MASYVHVTWGCQRCHTKGCGSPWGNFSSYFKTTGRTMSWSRYYEIKSTRSHTNDLRYSLGKFHSQMTNTANWWEAKWVCLVQAINEIVKHRIKEIVNVHIEETARHHLVKENSHIHQELYQAFGKGGESRMLILWWYSSVLGSINAIPGPILIWPMWYCAGLVPNCLLRVH